MKLITICCFFLSLTAQGQVSPGYIWAQKVAREKSEMDKPSLGLWIGQKVASKNKHLAQVSASDKTQKAKESNLGVSRKRKIH